MCSSAEFNETKKIFNDLTYDIFDIEDPTFDKDFDRFSLWVKRSEDEIGSVIVQVVIPHTNCLLNCLFVLAMTHR